jgi:hypothetical protein
VRLCTCIGGGSTTASTCEPIFERTATSHINKPAVRANNEGAFLCYLCAQPEAAGSGSLKEVPHGEDSELPGHDLTPAAAASVTAAKCYVHLATMQVCREYQYTVHNKYCISCYLYCVPVLCTQSYSLRSSQAQRVYFCPSSKSPIPGSERSPGS